MVRHERLGRKRLLRPPSTDGDRSASTHLLRCAYHGATAGSAALSGHQAQAAVIGGGQVTRVPYPDPYRCLFGPCDRAGCSLRCLEYVERYALVATSPAEDTAAVIMEAVQSDGGEVVPPANYIPALREPANRHGIWLVFDEVKVGLGRTGKWFGFEHAGVTADAVILGKPLGGGLPLSARGPSRAAGRAHLQPVHPGWLAASVRGRACALDVIEDERLLENAARMGTRLLEGLTEIQRSSRLVGDVRGRGLILGVEIVADRGTREPAPLETHRLVYRLFELGLLTIYSGLHGNVVEITPPLTIGAGDVDEALSIFEHALADVEAGHFDDANLTPFGRLVAEQALRLAACRRPGSRRRQLGVSSPRGWQSASDPARACGPRRHRRRGSRRPRADGRVRAADVARRHRPTVTSPDADECDADERGVPRYDRLASDCRPCACRVYASVQLVLRVRDDDDVRLLDAEHERRLATMWLSPPSSRASVPAPSTTTGWFW